MISLNERIERGRKALALAKKKGLDTFQWEDEIVNLELARAQEVARHTGELLSNQGWCLWKCSSLGEDIIVVCRNDLCEGYPEDYPVYMEYELEKIGRGDVSDGTLQLIHEAKKLADATLVDGRYQRG